MDDSRADFGNKKKGSFSKFSDFQSFGYFSSIVRFSPIFFVILHAYSPVRYLTSSPSVGFLDLVLQFPFALSISGLCRTITLISLASPISPIEIFLQPALIVVVINLNDNLLRCSKYRALTTTTTTTAITITATTTTAATATATATTAITIITGFACALFIYDSLYSTFTFISPGSTVTISTLLCRLHRFAAISSTAISAFVSEFVFELFLQSSVMSMSNVELAYGLAGASALERDLLS